MRSSHFLAKKSRFVATRNACATGEIWLIRRCRLTLPQIFVESVVSNQEFHELDFRDNALATLFFATKSLTNTVTPRYANYEFIPMPFSLASAPWMLNKANAVVSLEHQYGNSIKYMNDTLAHWKITFEDHLKHVAFVLENFKCPLSYCNKWTFTPLQPGRVNTLLCFPLLD